MDKALPALGVTTSTSALTINSPGSLTINSTTLNSLSVNGVSIGKGAGSGNFNVAIGSGAPLGVNALGSWNTAIGHGALRLFNPSVAGSNYNVACGYAAMYNFSSGNYNAAFGGDVMKGLSAGGASGTGNSAFGWGALTNSNFTDGNYNSAFGYGALDGVTTGDNNVGIGSGADVANGALDNQLSIQNVIYGTGMNNLLTAKIGIGTNAPSQQLHVKGKVRIEDLALSATAANIVVTDIAGVLWKATSCATTGFIPRNSDANGNMICSQIFDNATTSVGINTTTGFGYTSLSGFQLGTSVPPTSGNFRLSVEGVTRSWAFYAYSDKRLKKEIHELHGVISTIKKLNGVSYLWDKSANKTKDFPAIPQIGFIAQEIADVVPEAVVIDNEGYYSMNYTTFIPLLTEGIEEQQSQIETQQLEIENLKTQITELRSKLNQLTPGDVRIKINSIEVVPNPIMGTSIVTYKLDDANATSMLVISDLQGRLIKQITLAKNQQQGQVQVSKSDLPKGMYVFAIVSGNTEVQSKKVLVSE